MLFKLLIRRTSVTPTEHKNPPQRVRNFVFANSNDAPATMRKAGNIKLATILDRWTWLSDALASGPAEMGKTEFSRLSRGGSIRAGLESIRCDRYVGPDARVAAHLEPKIFGPKVRIDHKRISKMGDWTVNEVREDADKNGYLSWQPLRAVTKDFLVIDKPSAIPSIEPADSPESALSPHWLRRTLPRQLTQGALSITGRLDAGTHGLMVIGRSKHYTGLFNKEIRSRSVGKKYIAVVTGWNPISNPSHKCGDWFHYYVKRSTLVDGEFDLFKSLTPGQTSMIEYFSDYNKMRFIASKIQQAPYTVPVHLVIQGAKEAEVDSKALRCFHPYKVERLIRQAREAGHPLFELQIDLITGKTHQIRAQLWAEGLSIVGDWLYESHDLPEPDTFALCCAELSWTCPITQRNYTFDAR